MLANAQAARFPRVLAVRLAGRARAAREGDEAGRARRKMDSILGIERRASVDDERTIAVSFFFPSRLKKQTSAPLGPSPALKRSRGLDRRQKRRFAGSHQGGSSGNARQKTKPEKTKKVRNRRKVRARGQKTKLSSAVAFTRVFSPSVGTESAGYFRAFLLSWRALRKFL